MLLSFRHSDYKVVSPALRAVGNIVTGDDLQTQVIASTQSYNTGAMSIGVLGLSL